MRAPAGSISVGWRRLAIGVGVIGILATVWTIWDVPALLRDLLAFVEAMGAWGPVLFVAVYVVAAVCFVPGSILTLGAGAVFGVLKGSVYVSIASTLGATAAFLVGRHLAREWVSRKVAGNATFDAVDRAVADEGWKIVGLTRLSPVFPFTLLNYAFGLTRVSLREYVLASWIGMMPGTILYVYLGSLAQAGVTDRVRTTGEWVLYGVGLVATAVVTWIVTGIARRALARRTQANVSTISER